MKRAGGRVAAMLAAAIFAAGAAWARDAPPLAHIPLVPMGYQTLLPEFLLAGSSMLTVDFVDRDHLLITFGVRRLMRREPDDPPDDDDHTVDAVLVELPSGKLLARTEWRLHDRGQYLWSLGDGRFLLRVRDRLMVLAPLAAGGAKDAFREAPLLRFDRHIVELTVSPNKDLLTLETTGRAQAGDAAPVQIDFYRLMNTNGSANGLTIAFAGVVRARAAIALPITTAGILKVIEESKDRWLFNFAEHTGKVEELAEFDTSCAPQPIFVGHGEFVAFGCLGSTQRQALAGFNLKGEEMWQQNIDAEAAPAFAFAPTAGRFALGRVEVAGAVDPDSTAPLPEDIVSGQEVRVLQSYDGRLLFRIDCSPAVRAGGNFALSADGTRLAVVRETMVQHPATEDYYAYSEREAAVEVYALPQLTEKDQAAVKAAEEMAPKDTGARIDTALERLATPVEADAARGTSAANAAARVASASDPASAQRSVPPIVASHTMEQNAASEVAAPTATGGAVLGDPLPGTPRLRPTLSAPDEPQTANKLQ